MSGSAPSSAARTALSTSSLENLLLLEAERAAAAGRPVDASLLGRTARRERLADALRWTVREGLATREGATAVALDAARVLDDGRIARLAREDASAAGEARLYASR